MAECDGEVVGHVAASPVTLSDGTPDWFGLGPVSMLPGLILPGVPPAYFMALDWGDDRPQAEVAYHPAFAATA